MKAAAPSPAILSPFVEPQAWDVIQVGALTSPGTCELSGFKRVHNWDIKKGKGSIGATNTIVAIPPAEGSIIFSIWNDAQFQQWDQFVTLLRYDPTKKAVQGVEVFHPALAMIGITSLLTKSISAPEHAGLGLYLITVEFLEFFPTPQQSAVSTPTYSQPVQDAFVPPGEVPQDVPDAQQREIASLLIQGGIP